MNYYTIGQNIRKLRKAHGLSQEELAEKINISTTHMSHIETGNTKLSLPVLVDIAKALNSSVDLLIDDPENKNSDAIILSIYNSLSDCNNQELEVIYDVVLATKMSLKKHKM